MRVDFSVAASFVLVNLAQAIVWGPEGGGRGQLAPEVVDYPKNQEDNTVLRLKRNIEVSEVDFSDIGYTSVLRGDGHSQAIVRWSEYPSDVVFILTRRRTGSSRYATSDQSWLWRSLDYGRTFVNETSKWDNDTVIEWYYVSPISEYLIFVDQIHHKLYVTRDEGETYSTYEVKFDVDDITFQPKTAEHSVDPPYNEYILAYDETNQSLWVSTDLGENWRKLSDDVVADRYYWRQTVDIEGLGAVYFERAVNDTYSELCFVRDVADVHQEAEVFDSALGLFLSGTFVLEKEFMFVQKKINDSSFSHQAYNSPLWVSHNRASFRQAKFPFESEENHYSIVDASEGQVLIAVYHNSSSINLYISDAEGLSYSLSLDNVMGPDDESSWVGATTPQLEVHVMEGIVGTYIANKKVSDARYGTTVISFDKGGEWAYITPPAVDKDGNPIMCVPPECSLHLRLDNPAYQLILSRELAVGLLMAHGNLGSSVSRSGQHVGLYFSRDGGFTWFEVATGYWRFGFAALGSVVVAVPRWHPTSTVRWSCSEGGSWKDTTFSSDGSVIRVAGMAAAKRTRHAMLFGAMLNPFTGWLVVSLNFTSAVPDPCSPDDYFPWSPTDERLDDRCVLGETITYDRRNSTSCCYIDPLNEALISRTPCECTIEDFECDFGFERLNLNSPCTPLPWMEWPPPPPDDCVDGGTYNISSGYRKIAGDKCIPGPETYFFEQIRHCPIFPPGQLSISYTSTHSHPLENITFQLTQNQGGKLTTWYLWSFNDSSPLVNVTGYNSSSLQVHSFSLPGAYVVSVIAGNGGGSASTLSMITVFDIVSSVTIIPPALAEESDSVPAGVELLFGASLVTVYGTSITGQITYSWQFGDGTVILTQDPSVSHTYQSSGMYNVSLSVITFSQNLTESYHLNVYMSATRVQIVSDNIINGGWVVSGMMSNFTVMVAEGSTGIVPPDTAYSWHVTGSDGLRPVAGSGPVLSYSFPRSGRYELTVNGEHHAGSFSTQLMLTAEYYIDEVEIGSIPTVRHQHPAIVTIEARSSGKPYVGPLIYQISGEDGRNLTGLESIESYSGSVTSSVLLEVDSHTESINRTVVVHARNHVSSAVTSQSVGIVVKGEYGRIRLVISTSKLPSNFDTSVWMSMLKASVKHRISMMYPVSGDQVEIEAIQSVGASSTKAGGVSVGSRSSLMYVDVNILPSSINSDDIAKAKNVSNWLVLDVNGGTTVIIVNGSSLPFEAELRGPPSGLSLSHSPSLVHPADPIAFHLKQSKVGLLTTWYIWDFNDSTPLSNMTGYKSASSQSHIFHQPGVYAVSVFASNDEGSSEILTQITVFDVISGVSILLPLQATLSQSNASVPTGVQLVFTAVISTTYGSSSVGPTMYLWDFGDGISRESTDALVSHSYLSADTYLLTLTVRTPFSLQHTASYQLSAYKSATQVRILNIDDSVKGEWVAANVTTTFAVEVAANLSEVIPPDTYYYWNIVPMNGLMPMTQEGNAHLVTYSFPLHGRYDVSVHGNHSTGSFSAQLTLHAEYIIDDVKIHHVPTVRLGGRIEITVQAMSSGQPYIGQLSYQIIGDDVTGLIQSGSVDDYFGEAEVSFVPQAATVVSVETQFTVYVENHVSSALEDILVTVVVQGDYGCVRLMFDVSSKPFNFNSSHGMSMLKTSLVQLITQSYPISENLIEVGPVRLMKNEILFAEIYILPESLKQMDINVVQNISSRFISDVNSGSVSVKVNGTMLATVVEQCGTNPAAVTELTAGVEDTAIQNRKVYSATGSGLGVMLILSVIILIVSIALVRYYHKRYKFLQVQYSHLNQSQPAKAVLMQDDILEGGFCVEPDDLPLVDITTTKLH